MIRKQSDSQFSIKQIDAIVAMSLQHEEDAHRTSRPVRRFQNNIVRALNSFYVLHMCELLTSSSYRFSCNTRSEYEVNIFLILKTRNMLTKILQKKYSL